VTVFLGFVATRMFENALGVDSDFGAGLKEYVDVGVHAVVPFLIAWAFFLLLATMLHALSPLFRIPLAPIQRKASAVTATVDSETIAALVVVTGITCLVVIVWWCSAIIHAVDALRTGSTTAADLATLGTAGLQLRNQQAVSSAALSFLLGLIVWRWFPMLERHAHDASRIRILKWGAVTLALIVVLVATLPRRFMWERFEVVSFNHQPAFVIGRNSDEVLLYSPHVPKSKPWRVRKDSTVLERTGATGFIFDSQ
jgi:hypothetical protein